MMFTGGSPEVQKLVNQALAARAEASANGASRRRGRRPSPSSPRSRARSRRRRRPRPAQAATPPPQMVQPPAAPAGLGPRRSHGAAIAATMVALPAASARIPGRAPSGIPGAHADLDGAVQATPPPMAATPPPVAATPPPPRPGPAPTPKPAAGGTFRETLWFKKGDVDQMVAEARARVEAARGKVAPPPRSAEAPHGGRPPARGSLRRRRLRHGRRSQEVLAALRAARRRRCRPSARSPASA